MPQAPALSQIALCIPDEIRSARQGREGKQERSVTPAANPGVNGIVCLGSTRGCSSFKAGSSGTAELL